MYPISKERKLLRHSSRSFGADARVQALRLPFVGAENYLSFIIPKGRPHFVSNGELHIIYV